jgi:hypothetical protein
VFLPDLEHIGMRDFWIGTAQPHKRIRIMKEHTILRHILHDATLSFTDFCLISNALAKGLSQDEIFRMPELHHLQINARPLTHAKPASDPAEHSLLGVASKPSGNCGP